MTDEGTEAFGRFYIEVFAAARRYALPIVGPGAAEDIAQEIGLKLLERFRKNPDGFEYPQDVHAYAAQAARNTATDHLEREQADLERDGDFQTQVIEGSLTVWAEPDVAMETRAFRRALGKALAELSEPRRECLIRTQQDGLTYAQVAKERGISKKTVQHHVVAAKPLLREGVLRHLGDEE